MALEHFLATLDYKNGSPDGFQLVNPLNGSRSIFETMKEVLTASECFADD